MSKLINRKCKLCGELMTNVSHSRLYCDKCRKIKTKEQNNKYYKNKIQKYNTEDYVENFNSIINRYKEPYILTSTGFDEVSSISVKSYTCFFKENWYNLLKQYNQLDKLLNYIYQEYTKYFENTNDNSVENFISNHKYITKDAGKYFGYKNIKVNCGVLRRNYTLKNLESNFFEIKNKLGRIPNITEFIKLSKIHPKTYVQYYNLKGQIWDDIIRLFIKNEDEIQEFYKQQKEYISSIQSENSQKDYIYSNEELEQELKRVFDYYYNIYKTYPSRRLFNSVSKFHDFLYRKRFKTTWTKICKMYGYNINNDNHKSETICLKMIENILKSECTPQKTWDWLIGISNYNLSCDGYFEEYNLIVEFDGAQHRMPVINYGGRERYEKQIKNDQLKDKLLKEHGYKILRIDSRSKWYEDEYLITKLKDVGIQLNN